MTSQAGSPSFRDLASDYRRLAAALAARASRLGSRDPEAAAQEALRRSLQNPKSQPAIDYYFGAEAPAGPAPEWPLDQLLAWLHGVLQFVVREEQSRAAFHREVPSSDAAEPVDSSSSPLETLLDRETRAIVNQCFSQLDLEYREVLKMRMDGLKYGEIARRMNTNENTVATWISRAIRDLGSRIRQRMGDPHE